MSEKIDKAKLLAYIKEELKNVSKMKNQLTFDEIDKLQEEFTKNEIWYTLESMENYAPLTKKYLSVYRTCRSWCQLARKRELDKQQFQQKRLGLNSKMEYSEALPTSSEKGIPASEFEDRFNRIKDPNGKMYFTIKS